MHEGGYTCLPACGPLCSFSVHDTSAGHVQDMGMMCAAGEGCG